jgi:hypothetical protein
MYVVDTNFAAELESHPEFHIEDNLRAAQGFVAPARRPSGGAIVARVARFASARENARFASARENARFASARENICGRFSMGVFDLLRLRRVQ